MKKIKVELTAEKANELLLKNINIANTKAEDIEIVINGMKSQETQQNTPQTALTGEITEQEKALQRVNNRIRELQDGEMSVEELMDSGIDKGEIYYNVYDKKYDYGGSRNCIQSTRLPMRTQEIADQIIKEHKDDLDIIGGIKD